VDSVINAVQQTPAGDVAALRVAIEDVLNPTFSELRIPDRNLILGPANQPATDVQIQSGQFRVSSLVNEAKFSLVLDLQPNDLLILEP
jgi:hypothetical protein